MKIVLINGSHRKGNTQCILETMAKQLQKLVPQINSVQINLREKILDFCNEGDYYCTKTAKCQCCRDDMEEIYHHLETSDLVVLGSPIYYGNVSSRLKSILQRCFPYFYTSKLADKPVIFVGVGQSGDHDSFFNFLNTFANTMGMKFINKFYTRAVSPDDVANNQKVIKQIKQFCKQVVQYNPKVFQIGKKK